MPSDNLCKSDRSVAARRSTRCPRRLWSLRLVLAALPLGALLLAAAPAASALPDDRNQEIHIESDRAVREDKTDVSTYEGNVTIIQGSIQIKADKVTIHGSGDQVSHIVCVGKPARYQQQRKPDTGPMVATAATIEYYLDADVVHLIGNAQVDQDSSTLQGERIDYDLTKERVDARGGNDGKQRVRMVIPPGQRKEKN